MGKLLCPVAVSAADNQDASTLASGKGQQADRTCLFSSKESILGFSLRIAGDLFTQEVGTLVFKKEGCGLTCSTLIKIVEGRRGRNYRSETQVPLLYRPEAQGSLFDTAQICLW